MLIAGAIVTGGTAGDTPSLAGRRSMSQATVFEPRPLPRSVAGAFRRRLHEAHVRDPFSSVDPRSTVRRVSAIAASMNLETAVYRGGLELEGIEVDHVWLAVRLPESDDVPRVVDASFPLFVEEFVETLRRFVAGDVSPERLSAVAAAAGVDERVIGLFPPPMRYLGMPVWSSLS